MNAFYAVNRTERTVRSSAGKARQGYLGRAASETTHFWLMFFYDCCISHHIFFLLSPLDLGLVI